MLDNTAIKLLIDNNVTNKTNVNSITPIVLGDTIKDVVDFFSNYFNNNIDFTGAGNGDILLHNGTLFEPVNLVTALESLSLDVRIALGIEPAFVMRVNTATTGTGTVSGTNQMQLTGALGTYIVEAYQGNTLIANLGTFTGQQTLTLPSAGIYDLRIIPTGATPFNRIEFSNSGDRNKVLGIRYWGQAVQWSSFLMLLEVAITTLFCQLEQYQMEGR
jgi:hypothetical protein